MKNLRIIFMGTPEFAVPSLEILVENGYNVVAVITAPDKKAGRGHKLQTSAVKDCALKYNLPILQPTNLKSPEFKKELKSYEANLQVVVAFRMLPEVVWSMPEYGTFNLHASLLPQYRGAAPINWAIINGEKETGVTSFFLKHEIDTGDVILQEKEAIHPEDNVGTLYNRLMTKGGGLVLKTVQQIETDTYKLSPQVLIGEEKKAPKIFKETCEIDFSQPSQKVRDFVRGLSPYPAAWTMLNGKQCKIYETQLVEDPTELEAIEIPYFSDNKNFLYFKTNDGWVSILDLKLEGKKRMKVSDFLRGYQL